MLTLPSTTEVNRRLPKEAFYRNLKLSPKVKESFVRDIESIVVANSVKVSTANIADGEQVHEVLVMRIDLKNKSIPTLAIDAINAANPSKKLFVCVCGEEGCLVIKMAKLVVGHWKPVDELSLTLKSGSLDNLWNTLASQVVYNDEGVNNQSVEERFLHDQKIHALQDEILRLDARCKKEKQISKKNKLFEQKRMKLAELEALKEGR